MEGDVGVKKRNFDWHSEKNGNRETERERKRNVEYARLPRKKKKKNNVRKMGELKSKSKYNTRITK